MDMKQDCEKTFYRELYRFEGKAQALVIDETTGRVFLQKKKQVYDEAVYAFLREHHHPHVAAVYGFWKEESELVVLEEYIEGQTLEAFLEKGTPGREEALRIVREICEGLMFLHHARPPLIHRDIKASNIMLAKDGTVKIID